MDYISTKKKRILSVFLMTFLLCAASIRRFVLYVLDNESLNTWVSLTLILSAISFILINYTKIIKPAVFILCFAALVLVHYTIYKENQPYISLIFKDSWPYLVITFLCGYFMTAKDLQQAFFLGATTVIIVESFVLSSDIFYRQMTEYDYGGVQAVFSSIMMLPAIAFAFVYKWKGSWFYLLPSLLAFAYIVIFGGKRLSVVCYVLALAYIMIGTIRERKNKVIIISLLMILTIFMLYIYDIGVLLNDALNVNLSTTRLFDYFNKGTFAEDAARHDILNQLYNNIFTVQGILFGFGIMGDMYLTVSHEYSHNFFLELIVDFGLFFGMILIFVFLWVVYETFKKKTEYNKILIMLLFLCVIPLFLSGTFWNTQMFWLFIGICLKVLIAKKTDYRLKTVH